MARMREVQGLGTITYSGGQSMKPIKSWAIFGSRKKPRIIYNDEKMAKVLKMHGERVIPCWIVF